MTEIQSFGLYLRKLREEKKLTQTYIAEVAQVSEKTYRRIEMDKAIPRIDTLEEMSILFKEDLVLRFLKYNSQGMEMFEKIKEELDRDITQGNFDEIEQLIPRLKNLINTIKSPYYILQYQQYILMFEGIMIYLEGNRYDKSMAKTTEGIRMGIENFSIHRYKDFSYSTMELRLLMNIGFSLYRLGEHIKYLEIFNFIMEEVDKDDKIYPTVAYNLGTAYKRSEEHAKAIHYMTKGIESCQEKSHYSMLPLLYYGKGVSEYYLNRDSYKQSFINAVTLTKLLGLTHLNTSMRRKCKNNFHFDVFDEGGQAFL